MMIVQMLYKCKKDNYMTPINQEYKKFEHVQHQILNQVLLGYNSYIH